MKVTKVLAVASVTGVVAAGAITTPALAWHPKGVIKKYVQNQTTGSQLSDANTAATAVSAKPGDVLKYVIEVRNDGASGKTNEMHFTKMTDTLPAGVALVSSPSQRQISENIGVIKPGQKITKEYLVKVTADKAGMIENEACFTGDSEVKDNPQKGCDVADVKVTVSPKEEPKPEEPKEVPQEETPEQPETLPVTGVSNILAPVAAFGAGAVAYGSRLLFIKRRQK